MNKKYLVHPPKDYLFFKDLLIEHKTLNDIAIDHYCLMTNHAHLLIQGPALESMAKFSQLIQRRYAYYYCGSYRWSGSVFQRGYRSLPIDKDTYLLECGRYIERNPVKAHLCPELAAYPYSSFRYYGCGEPDDLLTPSPAYLGLAEQEGDREAIYSEYATESRIQEEMMGAHQLPC